MQDENIRTEEDLTALAAQGMPNSTLQYSDGGEGSTEQFTETTFEGRTEVPTMQAFGDESLSPIQVGQTFGDKVLAERGITSPDDIKAEADAQIEADRAEDDAESDGAPATYKERPGVGEFFNATPAITEDEDAAETRKKCPDCGQDHNAEDGIGIRVMSFDEDGAHDHGKKDPDGLFGFLSKVLGGGATPEQQATADAVWKHLVDTVSKTVPDHAYKTTKPMPEGLPGEDVMWEWTSAEGQYSIRAQSAVFLLGQSRPAVIEAFVSVGKNWGGRIVWNLEEIREDLQEELEDVLETFGAL